MNNRKIHPYAITPPKTESRRWQTCYRDARGNRKNIKAPTEEELLQRLADIYASSMNLDKLDFFTLYQEWLDYKKA